MCVRAVARGYVGEFGAGNLGSRESFGMDGTRSIRGGILKWKREVRRGSY